jgi:hypothetical protein
LEQGPNATKVELPNGVKGWIRLPNLSKERSEVVDFTGGIVRILRKDWEGASKLFQNVAENPRAPTEVRGDSYLYLAIAAAHSGMDPEPWISKAYELNPYSQVVLKYLCMGELRRIASNSIENKKAALGKIRGILNSGRPLYPPHDPWFNQLSGYVERTSL